MRIHIAVAIVLAGCAGSVSAADWTIDPRISLLGESDDNHRLTAVPGQEISVSGVEVDARLTIRAATPRTTFRLIPRIRSTFYPGDEDDETDDGFLRMDWEYRGEKSLGALNVDYAHRTVLGRFFPYSAGPDDGGLGEPGQGSGSGRTTFPTDQDDLRIRPRFTFELTERAAMFVRLGYQNVEFDEQINNDRENFTDSDAAAGMEFRTSPTAILRFGVGASLYEPENNLDTDSQSAGAEWSNEISETSRFYVRGGASRVKTDGATDPDWNAGFNGGAGVEWTFEVTDIFLDYNHYVDPSSSGRLVNRDHFRAEVARRFSERTTLRFAARAIRDAGASNDDTFETREFLSGLAEYEWRFTRQFGLLAGYEYTWREYEDDLNDAQSNRFYLGVVYEPHRL